MPHLGVKVCRKNSIFTVKLWSGMSETYSDTPINRSCVICSGCRTFPSTLLTVFSVIKLKVSKYKNWRTGLVFYSTESAIILGQVSLLQRQKFCNFCSTYKTLNSNILPFLEVKSRYSDQIWLKYSIYYSILYPHTVQRIELEACICTVNVTKVIVPLVSLCSTCQREKV